MIAKDPKKILIFVNVDWYFCLHWINRANELRKRGYVVHIVTNFGTSFVRKKMEDAGYHCHHIHLQRKTIHPFSFLKNMVAFFILMMKIRPHLIHCVTIKPNLIGGMCGKIFNIPTIMTVTGLGGAFSTASSKNRWIRFFVSQLYQYAASGDANRIVFENSEDPLLFRQLRIGKLSHQVIIKGAGVDIDSFSYRSTFPADNILLFAARLLKDKGLDDLIVACSILKLEGYAVRLRVAGILDEDNANAISKEHMERLKQIFEFEWLGQRKDMPQLIANADLIVLPTVYGEGVPRILIEASATGRPVVATNVVGCREIVKHGYNGILVPPRCPKALAAAIKKIFKNHNLQKNMGIKGRLLVEKQFADQHVIDATLALYDDLLGMCLLKKYDILKN